MIKDVPFRIKWPSTLVDGTGRAFHTRAREFVAASFPDLHYYHLEIFDGEVEAGYCDFREESAEDHLLLHDVQVYQPYSHRGLGGQFVALAEDEARRLGKAYVRGWVIASGHMAGQKDALAEWYRRLGFVVSPEPDFNPDNYGPMQKSLR